MIEIDLRSDTVTHPTPAMREAMARAEVGDDVFGEDPTVNRLEAMAAEKMGKEAALFVPSGTMGNLASILAQCGRGDEIILGDKAHTFLYEAGGVAALGGIHPHPIANQPDGTLEFGDIEGAVRADDLHFPITRLICLENTHNRCGGSALSPDYSRRVGEIARAHGLRLHLDGARIFNAAAAHRVPAHDLAEPADSVTFCLSKGLCAPAGSLICGDGEFVQRARRVRKQLGGGMRQVGVLAAAGIVALDVMVDRLADDHARARRLADGLKKIPGVLLDPDTPRTNMVYFSLSDEAPLDGAGLSARVQAQGIRIKPSGERHFRLVTHYWIDDEGVDRALSAIREALLRA
jgi:threonine aldolase